MPSTVSTDRQAPTDHLPQGGEVGGHAAQIAETPVFETEAADDLVKDEQRPVGIADLSKASQKFRALNQQPVVGRERLDDHRSNVIAVFAEEVLHGFKIVQWTDERRRDRVLGNTGTAGDAKGGQTAA